MSDTARRLAEENARAELGMAPDEPNGATGFQTVLAFIEKRATFLAGWDAAIEHAAMKFTHGGQVPGGALLPRREIAAAIRAERSDR